MSIIIIIIIVIVIIIIVVVVVVVVVIIIIIASEANLIDELAGAFLWYIYIYLYPWAVHLVPRGPPINAQRANVGPAS